MRVEKALRITIRIQTVFLVLMLLNLVCAWMGMMGVPYLTLLGIWSYMIIFLYPVEIFCFVANLICLIMDAKAPVARSKKIAAAVIVVGVFVTLCLFKGVLLCYDQFWFPTV